MDVAVVKWWACSLSIRIRVRVQRDFVLKNLYIHKKTMMVKIARKPAYFNVGICSMCKARETAIGSA